MNRHTRHPRAPHFYNSHVHAFTHGSMRSGRRACFLIPIMAAISMAANEPTTKPAGPDAQLRAARDHHLHGRYDKAIALCEQLAQSPATAIAAACRRAAIDHERGDYTDGLSRLRAVEKEATKDPHWHVALADLLADIGRYDESIEHARVAIKLDEESLRARWRLGQSLERLGRTKDAIEAYKHFDDIMTGDSLPDDAETLTTLGLGFYRYSTLTRTNLVQRTRHVLDESFGSAVDFLDAAYWPARQAAGELLLAKHNLADARDEFEKVLRQNDKAADAMIGLARSHLEDWNFDECETFGNRALEANPNHVGALVLLADLRMTERKYSVAAELAEKALKINPRSEEAIGALAAAKTREGDAKAAPELEKRVLEFNKSPALFHYALGQWLSAGRQFAPAEIHFKKAIEFAPAWPEPLTSLGQLYMELGDERQARKNLEAAFELDSFNQHTFNVLGLLDRIDKFASLESDHFIIKYDASEDAVVAPYFSRTLESIYGDVCDNFQTELKDKTIIELFPDHQGFSVRITGRPFIGTIGACTGRVIAMTAPRGRPPFGRFNWASVLRHEFTHTVTLAATGNRIPHWFTEGLAVFEEPAPRSWTYKQLLTDAIRRDRLFTLQTIDWGFARPKRPTDRSLAYAQSEWMSEYIIERFKYQAILELLAAFRDGRSQPAAFQSVLKISTDDFDRDFQAWAKKEAAKWGLPLTPVRDVEEIEKKLAGKPDDPALLAELAEARMLEGEFEKAKESAEKSLELDRKQPLALEVMCHLLVGKSLSEQKETDRRDWLDEAADYIDRLAAIQPENLTAIKYTGYLEQADDQWTEALAKYREYQKRLPEDPDSFRRMAAIYLRRRQFPLALRQLEALFRLVEDEPAVARQIARLYIEQEAWQKAAHWYKAAIEIDPYDPEVHGALADTLMASGEYIEAEREYQVVVSLLPDEPIGYVGLADAHRKLGNLDKAKAYEKRAEALGQQ